MKNLASTFWTRGWLEEAGDLEKWVMEPWQRLFLNLIRLLDNSDQTRELRNHGGGGPPMSLSAKPDESHTEND